MKIAIISDTHDNLANLDRFLSFVKKEKITDIFHCGDFTTPETLSYLVSEFDGKIFVSLGNADLKEGILPPNILKSVGDKGKEKISVFENFGEVELGNKKIIFSHFLDNIENEIKKEGFGSEFSCPLLAEKSCEKFQNKDYDFAFFGHTHRPSLKVSGKTKFLNPGNLAGLYYRPSFAILDLKTATPRLKIVDTRQRVYKF